MASLIDRLLKTGSVTSSLLEDSEIFKDKVAVKTPLPILNIAFGGHLDGGITPGVTIFAGESKTFKTALGLYCMRSYLDEHADGVGVLYDTEFGITPDYIRTFGIDPARVIHIPVDHIEQLKFDFIKKLDAIVDGQHVFFMVDSIGQISSKKEVEDATDEKSVTDMTRAKALRSLFRLITVQLAKKNLPCFMINHVYVEIGGMYPKTIIPGGTSVTYSANTIFVITKAQEKKGDDLLGWKFTLNVHKSRSVREKSQLPFTVYYDEGVRPYSGLIDLSIELGAIVKPANGWYSRVDLETGVVEDKKFRMKDTDNAEFWEPVLSNDMFRAKVRSRFCLGSGQSRSAHVEETTEGE